MTTDFGCGDQSRELEGNRKGSLVCETYPLEWQHRLRIREWMSAGNGYELSMADLRPTYCLVNIPAATISTANPALTLSAVVPPTPA